MDEEYPPLCGLQSIVTGLEQGVEKTAHRTVVHFKVLSKTMTL